MPLKVEPSPDARVLTLEYEPRNALDFEAVTEITSAVRGSRDTPLVITGSGGSFCAGVNVKSFDGYSGAHRSAFFNAISEMISSITRHPSSVVAAVNGHALGGGFVLMLCADYRIVASNAEAIYGLTEAAAGVPFPNGALALIQRELPAPYLRSLALTSRRVTATDLLQQSVVDEILPKESLLRVAVSRARSLADQAAYTEVKRQVRLPTQDDDG